MSRPQKILQRQQSHVYRSLVATLLLANGIFHVAPVFAEGTAAGQSISNEATATYEDPNNPDKPINTTSNTVIVTVAEVAGITVTASGIGFKNDTNGQGDKTPDSKVNVGDTLYYTYTIKNVGNDPTQFRIPNLADVSGPGKVDGNLEISEDGGKTWKEITNSEQITKSIAPDGNVLARVPVLVTNGAKDADIIQVQLGDTPGDAQNQPRKDNGGDVYTVDNTDPAQNVDPVTGEVKGVPSNGVREASATQETKVGGGAIAKALATILKTLTGKNPGDLTKLDDDVLTYSFTLKVEGSDRTNTGITPAPLTGTPLNVDSAIPKVTRILISDAIPVNTVLDPNSTPTAPVGWQVVYTNSSINTSANDAEWKTTKPGGTITRVGFITKIETSIAPGETVQGFTLPVKSTVTTKTVIANIAQLFGQTIGDLANTPPIYDESGDESPTNFDPVGKTFTPFNPAQDTGRITPATNPADGNNNGIPDELENTVGVDLGNNNSGTGVGGEANVVVLDIPSAISVLTGPQNAADAFGPNNDNNKDFTNKSALVEANTVPLSRINPEGITFTNTLRNTGQQTNDISIVPTPLDPGKTKDLPDKTLVTISKGSLSATYEYDQANNKFTFKSSQGTVNGNPISDTNPIRVDGVKPGENVDYGVEVNLPSNTPLSTDKTEDYSGDQEFGFPVPITVYIEDNATPNGLQTTEPKNTTIDRVYTGFLRLLKESRVLQGTGTAVQGTDGTFSTSSKKPAPGNILEYRITYTNISTPDAGNGNVILKANSVVITEDGTTKPNNWALDNDANGEIDTSNIVGSAQDPNGNIKFSPGVDQTGTTAAQDVTKYVDEVTSDVLPGQERKFTFQRLVNGTNSPTGKVNNPTVPE